MTTGNESAPSADVPREARLAELLLSAVGGSGAGARTFETHGARVFVGPQRALKIKRAVRYTYMDFSTLEKRHAALRRELEINRPAAPEIYLGLVPITEANDGTLALAGAGRTVEWALEMRAFRQQDLLAEIAAKAPFGPELAAATADAVLDMHREAAPALVPPGGLDRIVAELAEALPASAGTIDAAEAVALTHDLAAEHARLAPLLDSRRRDGHVRRCHGDLHLANIVLWKGKPVPFDALEFDEALATIDVLYDLAFLLMDLDRRDRRADANAILNRYLWRSGTASDLDALAALPLFLALRAGIRAMVATQKAALSDAAGAARAEAVGYFRAAQSYLLPAPPTLVAIGGLSGTGKSTLGAALAPALGRAPGAIHLRSDLERKALAGVDALDRLPPSAYTPAAAAAVYARLLERARHVLDAGHSVVLDAVYARPEERAEIEALAAAHADRVAFIWLDAPADVLRDRVAARRADASDATPDVVDRQLARGVGDVGWTRIEAGASAAATFALARARLGI